MASLRFKSSYDRAGNVSCIKPFQHHIHAAIDAIEKRILNPDSILGISTGFHELDLLSDGFQPAEVFLIASLPNLGKTTFILNLLHEISVNQKRPAALFGLDISASLFAHRLIIARSNVQTSTINADLLKQGILDRDQMRTIASSSNQLSKSNLFIDERSSLDIRNLAATARHLKKEHRIKIIVIDSLSSITSKRHHPDLEKREIADSLKNLAKELNLPMVVFAQLQECPDHPFSLHDLQEWKPFAQRSDRVALLTHQTPSEKTSIAIQARLTLIKNHFGPPGSISLHFNPKNMRFTDTEVSHSPLLN